MEQDKDKRDWSDFRGNLNGNYDYTGHKPDWDRAIEIFSERLNDFYFIPIKRLLPYKKGEGFSIVTLQCALIETFAAFKYGKVYKEDLNNESEEGIFYKNVGNLFVRFLKDTDEFKQNFEGDTKPKASKFYSDVRCGLMHETRTRKDWVINTKATKADKENKIFIKQSGGKINIYRNQLQEALVVYFDWYTGVLGKKVMITTNFDGYLPENLTIFMI
jgi:hypothetical protein